MANLLTYIEEVTYETFYDFPLNQLDILALTELSYLPFDGLVSEQADCTKAIRIDHLAQTFRETYTQGFPPFSMVTKNRLQLLRLLAQSQRFRYLKVLAYRNDYDPDLQKQFAALTYRLNPHDYLVCFRGTDDSLIGWKEDFHMTYMAEIPAQQSATLYLQHMMENLSGSFHLAGHSKGGNLAIYAGSQIPASLQKRLATITAYDAPGVHQSILDSSGFQAIESKIYPIIPQHSIVGMMLQPPKGARIVHSKSVGLLQHITFSWEVKDRDFLPASALTGDSLQVDKTLKSWTDSLTEAELQDFFDCFFSIFTQAGIQYFSDLTVNTPTKIYQLAENSQQLDPEEREMLKRLIHLLIDTRYQIWKESLQDLLPKPSTNWKDWWPAKE